MNSLCMCVYESVRVSAEIMTICKRVWQAAEQAEGDEDTEIADKGEQRGGQRDRKERQGEGREREAEEQTSA